MLQFSMDIIKTTFFLFRNTVTAYFADRAAIFAAGLAYFTIFALAPLLVIMVSFAGLFIGRSAAGELIINQLQIIMGPELSGFLEQLMQSLTERTMSRTTTILSVGALLVGASGIFNQLKTAVNSIWGVSINRPSNPREWFLIGKRRVMPVLMVFLFGLLLAISVIADTILGVVQSHLEVLVPAVSQLLPAINRILVPILTYITFFLIYKVLPDATTSWRNVAIGSLFAALLFLLGRFLLTIFLSFSGTASIYGAAGSIIILLIWIYFSSSILLLGAEFIKEFSAGSNAPIRPKKMAAVEAKDTQRNNS